MRSTTFVAMLAFAGFACSDDVSGPSGNNGVPNLPAVGDLLTLNVPRDVDEPCDAEPDPRDGRVVAVTSTAIVVVDTANPSGGLTDQEYAGFGEDFDEWGYPVVAQYFGEPSDLDENERVIAFFTRAVNEYTEEGDEGFVFGLFWPGDLFPSTGPDDTSCRTSNDAEVLYLSVPDPTGNAGLAVAANAIRNSAVSTMGHELQHLVNASRRLYVPPTADAFEEVWLNEGLSHVTEELMFFERAGSGPGNNIDVAWLRASDSRRDAFNQFQVQNFSRFAIFLENPHTDTASLLNAEGTLASRGADWHFLRYAADRRGSEDTFWWDLVNTELTGLVNLTQALGTDPEDWIRDWSAAVYADDQAVDSEDFQVPSWNLRDIYPAFRDEDDNQIYPEYPLTLNDLTDGEPVALDIAGMAPGYIRVEVPATGAATITISSVDSLENLRVSVVNVSTAEVTQHAGADAAEIALDGGAGATYVLAALNASTIPTSTLALEFESDGAGPPLVASVAAPDRAWAARGSVALSAALATSRAAVPLPAVNHRFHVEFLERAQRQLTPRIAYARQVYHERERLRDMRDR